MKRLATVMILAALAIGLTACKAQGVPAGSSDSPTAAPSVETSGTSPPATPPSRASGGDCRPGDLDARPWYGTGAASGSAGEHVTVRNVSDTPCRLATYPTLVSTDTAGTAHPLATDRYPVNGQTTQQPVLLAPGGYADLMTLHPNGWSGYAPTDPKCANPVDHVDLSVLLAGGQAFPLPGLHIVVQCGDLSLGAWAPISNPQTDLPNPQRAPAPGGDTPTCRMADLDPRPYYGHEGAAGSAITYVLVTNTSGKPCALGTYPMLDNSGKPIRQEANTVVKAFVLAPGKNAQFETSNVNGYGPLSPTDPSCQQPQDYGNLSLDLDNGQHMPLPGLEVAFKCSDLKVGDWGAGDLSKVPSPTRAP